MVAPADAKLAFLRAVPKYAIKIPNNSCGIAGNSTTHTCASSNTAATTHRHEQPRWTRQAHTTRRSSRNLPDGHERKGQQSLGAQRETRQTMGTKENCVGHRQSTRWRLVRNGRYGLRAQTADAHTLRPFSCYQMHCCTTCRSGNRAALLIFLLERCGTERVGWCSVGYRFGGGQRQIRSSPCLLECVSYGVSIARNAINATVAADHCTLLHAGIFHPEHA